jgi:hypothetical protein
MNIDRDLILNRFKKMDTLLQNLKEIKKKAKKNFYPIFCYI